MKNLIVENGSIVITDKQVIAKDNNNNELLTYNLEAMSEMGVTRDDVVIRAENFIKNNVDANKVADIINEIQSR